MDQVELDAAYDQIFYAPLQAQIIRRQASNSELERLLEEVLSSRSELVSISLEEADEALPAQAEAAKDRSGASVAELRREADAVMDQASSAIRASMRAARGSCPP